MEWCESDCSTACVGYSAQCPLTSCFISLLNWHGFLFCIYSMCDLLSSFFSVSLKGGDTDSQNGGEDVTSRQHDRGGRHGPPRTPVWRFIPGEPEEPLWSQRDLCKSFYTTDSPSSSCVRHSPSSSDTYNNSIVPAFLDSFCYRLKSRKPINKSYHKGPSKVPLNLQWHLIGVNSLYLEEGGCWTIPPASAKWFCFAALHNFLLSWSAAAEMTSARLWLLLAHRAKGPKGWCHLKSNNWLSGTPDILLRYSPNPAEALEWCLPFSDALNFLSQTLSWELFISAGCWPKCWVATQTCWVLCQCKKKILLPFPF